jgi:hypothetical protein
MLSVNDPNEISSAGGLVIQPSGDPNDDFLMGARSIAMSIHVPIASRVWPETTDLKFPNLPFKRDPGWTASMVTPCE